MRRALGVNTWVWTSPLDDDTLTTLAPSVRGWGFDTIELPIEQPGDWDPRHAARILDDLGLDATVALVMPPGRELVEASPATVIATQDYLRHVIDIAAHIGAPIVAGPAYSSVGRTWRMNPAQRYARYAELRQNLVQIAEHAATAGVKLALEPLNRYETSFINTVDQALDALRGLPEQHCGIALDVYHMNIEERSIPDAIRRAGARVAHVQVCGNDRGAPGSDHLPWRDILTALDDVGYGGPLVIESFTADNAAIATAAAIWRPLASTQDELATAGLEFLRTMQNTKE